MILLVRMQRIHSHLWLTNILHNAGEVEVAEEGHIVDTPTETLDAAKTEANSHLPILNTAIIINQDTHLNTEENQHTVHLNTTLLVAEHNVHHTEVNIEKTTTRNHTKTTNPTHVALHTRINTHADSIVDTAENFTAKTFANAQLLNVPKINGRIVKQNDSTQFNPNPNEEADIHKKCTVQPINTDLESQTNDNRTDHVVTHTPTEQQHLVNK